MKGCDVQSVRPTQSFRNHGEYSTRCWITLFGAMVYMYDGHVSRLTSGHEHSLPVSATSCPEQLAVTGCGVVADDVTFFKKAAILV